MGTVPRNIAERIQYYQARQTVWTTNAAALGILPAEMTTMSGRITAAVTALSAQGSAQTLSKAATVTLHDADRALSLYGADLIKKIKAKAGQDGDSVYALAQIDPPSPSSPVGPPGTPYQLVVMLNPNGTIKLKWRCDNPAGSQGTFYQVGRRPEGVSEFTYLGGSGGRSFVDSTLPTGSSSMVYSIQAMRTTAMGQSAEFLVKFGVSSSGVATTSVTELTPRKIAA